MDSIGPRAVVSTRRKLAVLAGRLTAFDAEVPSLMQPALPQVAFLIDAVTAAAPPRAFARRRPVEDRVVWVLDLFTRLEQRDRLQRSRP